MNGITTNNANAAARAPLLQVEHLAVSFTLYSRGLRQRRLEPIRDLSLNLEAGEITAVVGASGSGKSLLAHAILGLLPDNAAASGRLLYQGQPLTQPRLAALRGREIALVPQNVSFLDPLIKVGDQLRQGERSAAARQRCAQVLASLGLEPAVEQMYPFELSGGMARRVLIASAMLAQPRLVIADEPTPGLHLDAARLVLGHFQELAAAGAAVLLITHDLRLALSVAQQVVVFYQGRSVETAPAAAFALPELLTHPFSRALLAALPERDFAPPTAGQPDDGHQKEGEPR